MINVIPATAVYHNQHMRHEPIGVFKVWERGVRPGGYICPGGICPMGMCLGGKCPGGKCPGNICLRGKCPRGSVLSP